MKRTLRLLSIGFICLGILFLIFAFNKKDVYEYYEYNPSLSKNAYVGGDAYNYIINGTYFTGYMVLSGTFFIMGTISVVGASIIEATEKGRASQPYSSSSTPGVPSNGSYLQNSISNPTTGVGNKQEELPEL